ncbi:MAG: hypothetical protein NTW74_03220 [Acidobacteria bacterium]|nr:hypothetical protein [Acidobacteriota bacterium]
MNRIALFVFLASSLAFAQETIKISAEREAALKQRVSKFWDGFVAAKYRQSDALVSEESKDAFFSWPKKQIKGYKIDQIFYADGGKAAKVVTLVDTTMAMMGVGAMEIKQPIEAWWREEADGWYWFQPKNQTRATPFGTMESNPESGTAALVPTGQFNANPDLKKLMSLVRPDRQQVEFTQGVAKVETVTFKNGMQGTVILAMDTPAGEDVTYELSSRQIKRDGEATLTISYKPSGKPAKDAEPFTKIVRVGVAQTGKMYEIKASFNPPKP